MVAWKSRRVIKNCECRSRDETTIESSDWKKFKQIETYNLEGTKKKKQVIQNSNQGFTRRIRISIFGDDLIILYIIL